MHPPGVVFLLLVALHVSADMYLHQPRGSNNRLDDENRDRNNANRCFDSQNNNRGGSNVGQVYYYTGSIMYMSWTSQHSCGNPNNECEVILQYACDPKIRDGTTQNTVPINNQDCQNFDCDSDIRFCRHESFLDYQNCQRRSRNKGLFTASQVLSGDAAIFTRQNPNGARRGLECPEERDYYPYWAPTIWRDIAILTNQPNRCTAYKAESQNVKSRWTCRVPSGWVTNNVKSGKQGFIPITKDECESTMVKWKNPATNVTEYGVWTEVPAWGISAPDCVENIWCRDNHLGNCRSGFPAGYNWTIPADIISENCVLRIRYNISTGDFQGFADSVSVQSSKVNASLNSFRGDSERDPAKVDLWTKQGLNYSDVADCFNRTLNGDQTKLKKCREYVLKDNPKVDIFGSLLPSSKQIKLQLAVNTAQYGRTFQDRTHRFAIRPKPADIGSDVIHNVQVQGKRGNIVQVFPGVEYDFYPNILHVKTGDYVHFQWTGSNTNPDNNAGQGRQGSDRHNIVALRPSLYNEGQSTGSSTTTYGQWGRSYPLGLLADSEAQSATSWRFLGLSYDDLLNLATLKNVQFGGDMDELNDAGTYFDLGPRKITQKGIYHYLCTRNNNFSNRGQKAKIIVSDEAVTSVDMGRGGGEVASGKSTVVVPASALNSVVSMTITTSPNGPLDNVRSDYVTVSPLVLPVAPGQKVQIKIGFDPNPLGAASVHRADSVDGPYSKVSADISGSTATISTTQGGVFVVRAPNNDGAIAGVTIAIVFVLIVVGFCAYRYTQRKKTAQKANVAKAAAKSSGDLAIAETSPPPSVPVRVSEPTTGGEQRQLPPGWQAVQDPKDLAWYYVHPVTGKSQWEFPEA